MFGQVAEKNKTNLLSSALVREYYLLEITSGKTGMHQNHLSVLKFSILFKVPCLCFVGQQLWLLSEMMFRQGALCCIYHCNL